MEKGMDLFFTLNICSWLILLKKSVSERAAFRQFNNSSIPALLLKTQYS